ncbi:MAG TPA: hypothetical protein VGJ86_10065 [Acidimicrobiales bacterium]|jgi:hypothetical protein
MRLLHRDPDEAVLESREKQLRREAFEEPPGLRWDLVDNHWDLGSVLGASVADVHQRDGVMIVTPAGALPDPLPVRLAEQLEALITDGPVIVDIGGIIVVSAAPVVRLAGWVLGARQQPGRCCVVCPRATARVLLRKWHITRCLAVFGSIGDALQARRFAHEGYGSGWHPDLPRWDRLDPSIDCSHAVEWFERLSVPEVD